MSEDDRSLLPIQQYFGFLHAYHVDVSVPDAIRWTYHLVSQKRVAWMPREVVAEIPEQKKIR
jgi:hypothetical protein